MRFEWLYTLPVTVGTIASPFLLTAWSRHLAIHASSKPRSPAKVAEVRRKSCGVKGLRPSSAQMPGVLTLPFLYFVPRSAFAIAARPGSSRVWDDGLGFGA